MAIQWSVTDREEVLRVLKCDACCEAVVRLRQLIPESLRGVQDPTPPKRDPVAKWTESTLVDKGLPMGEYLEQAKSLFPRTVTGEWCNVPWARIHASPPI